MVILTSHCVCKYFTVIFQVPISVIPSDFNIALQVPIILYIRFIHLKDRFSFGIYYMSFAVGNEF